MGTRIQTLKLRMGPITKAVLATIAIAGLISMVAIAPGMGVAMAPFMKKKRYMQDRLIQRNLTSLKKHGLIEIVERQNGTVYVRLTKRGAWETSIRKIGLPDHSVKKWDGKWRMVIFDVNEKKRKTRNELRRAMVLYGFVRLQQSVWVYPFPCDDFVTLIKNHLGIAPDVLYALVDSIENEKHLRQQFKLA